MATTPGGYTVTPGFSTNRTRSASSSRKHEKVTIGEIATQLISASSAKDAKHLNAYLNGGGVIYPNIIIPKSLFVFSGIDHSMMTESEEENNIENRDENSSNQDNSMMMMMMMHALTFRSNRDQLLKKRSIKSREEQQEHWSAYNWLNNIKYQLEKWAIYAPFLQLAFSARNVELDKKRSVLDPALHTTVLAFDWHNTLFRFAVALQDQCIYFYDLMKEEWKAQVLRHDFHRDIRVIRYKPYPQGSTTLAVACRHGICLWELNQRLTMFSKQNLPQEILRDETQNGVCIFLQTSCPVTSLEWFPHKIKRNSDPYNQLKFASASEYDHRVAIWEYDASKQKWGRWHLSRFNGGIRGLAFSPNGKYLAVFTNSNIFRIWDTDTWETEKWSSFNAPVQGFAWSSNSNFLLISTLGSHLIHVIEFSKPSVSGEYKFEIDLSQHPYFADKRTELPRILDEDTELPRIRSFALDHAGGERIVIAFENYDRLAVLRCDFDVYKPEATILPVSSHNSAIYAPREAKGAYHLQFWNNFRKGSLLSCCWSNGKISLIPFYYSSVHSHYD
jgi:aladin